MDFLKKMGNNQTTEVSGAQQTGNTGGGFMDKVNNSMGGGKSGEAKEGAFQNLFSYSESRSTDRVPLFDQTTSTRA